MPITINGSGTVTGITAGGLPDAIITQPELATGVAGTGPAFSAYAGSSTTLTSNSFVKIILNSEEFDTAGCFDNTTNYRFTPTVAGYYQVDGCVASSNAAAVILSSIYKNGSRFKDGSLVAVQSQGGWSNSSSLIYFNGSTDYVELYCYMSGVATLATQSGSSNLTYFQASMVRSA
jgi:hypothetical protein